MRLFFIVFILLSPILVSSQTWKAAEWTISDNEKVTGWVKLPPFIWKDPASIKLKIDKKGNPFNGSGVLSLNLLESQNDTLIKTSFFDGRDHQLQQLIKGKSALFVDISDEAPTYYLFRKGVYEKWDRYNIKEDITALFDETDQYLYHRILVRDIQITLKLIRQLSRPQKKKVKKEKEHIARKKRIPAELAISKWRLNVTAYLPNDVNERYFIAIKEKKKRQFNIGIERNFSDKLPHLSADIHLSYSSLKMKGIYYSNPISYESQIKTAYFKIFGGLRFEFLPRKNLSPFIAAGFVFSIPGVFERNLVAQDDNPSFGGQLTSQDIRAQFSPERGKFLKVGLRFNLSTKLRFNIILNSESFPSYINFAAFGFRPPFFDLRNPFKKTPNVQLIGLSFTYAF